MKALIIAPAFVGFCLGVIVIGTITIWHGGTASDERRRAIAAKVASWTVDPATGKTTFEYITPKE